MSTLDAQFQTLAALLQQLLALLEEVDENFWAPYLARGLQQVQQRHLAGATFVLGCYGGEDTFSDLVLCPQLAETDPLRFRNLNARLTQLRTDVFEAANAITARRAW